MTADRVETSIRAPFCALVVAAPDAETSTTAAISAPTKLNRALVTIAFSSPVAGRPGPSPRGPRRAYAASERASRASAADQAEPKDQERGIRSPQRPRGGSAESGVAEAIRLFEEFNFAFDLAQARFALGSALRSFGDVTGARVEFERARTIFVRLGAEIRRDAIDRVLSELVEGPTPAGPSTLS